jgi:two-component system, chemotaxis family, protein-glutamate methylesterase/glutaminase
MDRQIRVLVVDDSAYVRKIVKEMLSRAPAIDVVGTARDGEEALLQVRALNPDVVTCDLIMPEVDGVEFIRRQFAVRPLPVVVVSIAAESSERVLAALDAGAIDFVQKPTALATDRIFDMADELVAKVTAAAAAPLAALEQPVRVPVPLRPPAFARCYDIVTIGVSTGGPQGLKVVISALPADFPAPIAIVLHMPIGYTEGYARRLNELSALTVVEARDGDRVDAGTVYVAQAGRHLTFRRRGAEVLISLDVKPLDTAHRPSVDVMFQSAADVYGSRVLGVVMTGMGNDGCEGAAWIKARGGVVLTEAEQSCVVYGMPRAVVDAGLSDDAVPLHDLPQALLHRI